MIKFANFLIVLLIIGACTPGGVLSSGEIFSIEIEGETIQVQQYNNLPNSWAAAPANLMGGRIDPNDYRRNIAAIEITTGCKVDTVTVVNQGMQSIAAVICS